MEYFQLSDVGKANAANEDSFGCTFSKDGKVHFFIVADGMGGYCAGEIASGMATALFLQAAEAYEHRDEESLRDFLLETVGRIDRAIAEKAHESKSYSGMGTTAVIYAATPDYALFGNVGDSRGYLMRDGKLVQITKDHSWIQSMMDKGVISETAETNNMPYRNAITRALGYLSCVEEETVCDLFKIEPKAEDVILLCSDGLTSMLAAEEILSIMNCSAFSAETVSKQLIEEANLRGGYDNITVSVIRYGGR